MYENIESMLLAQQPELYSNIKQISVENLKLSINFGKSVIWFGKDFKFCLFWINKKRGVFYFNARKECTRLRTDNNIKIEFVKANQSTILEAIYQIYNSYLQTTQNDNEQQQKQRIELQESIETIIANTRDEIPDIILLWNNVTVSSFEKLDEHCYYSNTVDADTIEKLKMHGQRLEEVFNDLLLFVENDCYSSLSRKLSIYREYIESDKISLADIAPKYNVSRENIRQHIKRVDDQIFGIFKKAMLFDNEDFNDYVEQITEIFKAVDYDLIGLVVYGLTNVSGRKKQAIFNMLFGKEFAEKLIYESESLTKSIREQNGLIKKENDIINAWNFYRSKICYPSSFSVDPFTPIKPYKKDSTFEFEIRFYKKLRRFESIIEIITNPDIIYYSTSQTDHRPHFILRLPDKTSVLVLVLPTINMAFIYNVQRCNELHRFCKEHGYGYLIIDDRGNSIYDIMNRSLDPDLVDCLNTILNNQSMIVWKNIKDIKLIRPVSNEDIAAYVLQNKLHFTMEPFCIKRRFSEI